MRRLAALLAVLVGLVAASPAVGYGTSTSAAGSVSTPTGLGTWTNGAGATTQGDGQVATLTETAVTTPLLYPVNRTFSGDASGWTSSVSGDVSVSYDGGAGNPAGSLLVTLPGGLIGKSGTATLRSDTFTWSGGTPASASFSIDRRAETSAASGADWRVRLVDLTDATLTKDLVALSALTDDSSFRTVSVSLAPSDLRDGHGYRIEIFSDLRGPLLLAGDVWVRYDNVILSVTPAVHRAEGEVTVPDVTEGSTMTLELGAGADDEAFDVQVWDGAAWNARRTVPVGPLATITYGLLPGERVGGQVRARFVDQTRTGDTTASNLTLDYLRVVSTGGITLSGPATVTLPGVTIDGRTEQVASGAFGAIEVTDGGGLASGWSLTATAERWALVGDATKLLPPDAWSAAPRAPSAPDGDSLTGVSSGAGGVLHPTEPIVLMAAAAGGGIGRFLEDPLMTLRVPPNVMKGDYRSVATLTVA